MSLSFPAPGASDDPSRPGTSGANGRHSRLSETLLANQPVAASRLGWDRLSEPERREQLDAMHPTAPRSMAASMPVIEQAKGVLMSCYGCDATAAFSMLVRLSSTKNIKLRDLAGLVVEAASGQTSSGNEAELPPTERVRRVLRISQEGSAHADDGGACSGWDDRS